MGFTDTRKMITYIRLKDFALYQEALGTLGSQTEVNIGIKYDLF